MKEGVYNAHLLFLKRKKRIVKNAQKINIINDKNDKNGNNILQITVVYGILNSSSETFPKRRKKE